MPMGSTVDVVACSGILRKTNIAALSRRKVSIITAGFDTPGLASRGAARNNNATTSRQPRFCQRRILGEIALDAAQQRFCHFVLIGFVDKPLLFFRIGNEG